LSRDEQKMLEELWQDAQKMESRINALETILDDQVPEWRRRT
jgi:phage shock protein B